MSFTWIIKQVAEPRLYWSAIALCCGFLVFANLMLPLSTVHSRSRTHKRVADLQSTGDRPVSAQELREALIDVRAISDESRRLLNINVYVPAIIVFISLIGIQMSSRNKKKSDNEDKAG